MSKINEKGLMEYKNDCDALIDLTADTVTAHNAADELITGVMPGGGGIQMASGSCTYTGGDVTVSGIAFTSVMVIACVDISSSAMGSTHKKLRCFLRFPPSALPPLSFRTSRAAPAPSSRQSLRGG